MSKYVKVMLKRKEELREEGNLLSLLERAMANHEQTTTSDALIKGYVDKYR